MPSDEEANERSTLLDPHKAGKSGRSRIDELRNEDANSIISSHLSKDEQALGDSAIGERLPYNDYTTIDWLHDLVRMLIACNFYVQY